mgnify:CR=1 FL=1
MAKIYTSADQLIGKTPLLELTHIEKELNLKAKILAKLEYFNPGGSAKDRVGYYMIVDAERQKKLKKNGDITEDEQKKAEKDLQDMLDKMTKKVDAALAAKEKELMAI